MLDDPTEDSMNEDSLQGRNEERNTDVTYKEKDRRQNGQYRAVSKFKIIYISLWYICVLHGLEFKN